MIRIHLGWNILTMVASLTLNITWKADLAYIWGKRATNGHLHEVNVKAKA